MTRNLSDLLADLAEAADAAAELVGRGRQRWDSERPLALARPPGRYRHGTPEIPWREVRGMRIIAAHAYHRIDYEEVWITLRDDVPRLAAC